MKGKSPKKSALCDKVLVNPSDLNADSSMHGGRLFFLLDHKAAIVARDHSGYVCRTISFSPGKFFNPVDLGDEVIIEAKITRSWNTTMEVRTRSYAKGVKTSERRALILYFYFIAIENNKPQPVPKVNPRTKEERAEYALADERREIVKNFIEKYII